MNNSLVTKVTNPMADDAKYSEQLLMRGAVNGDRAALKAIYGHYIGYLTAVCSRYIANDEDVKDILQECFIKIFSSLKNFEYRGAGSLKGWMARIVINEALSFMRSNNRLVFTELTGAERDIAYEEPDTDQIPPSVIHQLICDLPTGYRTIFNLYVIEGRTHRDIAAMLNIKESTSASQLHRAKAMLAIKIRQYQSSLEPVSI